MPICCPKDNEANKANWECRAKPENRLAQQPKNQRFRKRQADYRSRGDQLTAGWAALVAKLSEAKRFNDDFLAATQTIPV